MMIPDLINSFFEGMASFALLDHCRILYKDKQVKGVSIPSTVFFAVWGYWNLFYYNNLNQTFSTIAASILCLVQALYVVLLFKYRRKHENKSEAAELARSVSEYRSTDRIASGQTASSELQT